MKKVKVGVIVGSARKGAFSRAVAEDLMGLLPEQFEAEIVEIADLTMYNQDFDDEGRVPAEWGLFRAKIQEKEAYLFITPEYNRSIPALLKNALDIGSRPYGSNAWGGKPIAIISVSPGKPGAFGANHHLRQVATVLDMYTMQQPEAYIGSIHESLGADGHVADESLKGFLKTFGEAFGQWVGHFVS